MPHPRRVTGPACGPCVKLRSFTDPAYWGFGGLSNRLHMLKYCFSQTSFPVRTMEKAVDVGVCGKTRVFKIVKTIGCPNKTLLKKHIMIYMFSEFISSHSRIHVLFIKINEFRPLRFTKSFRYPKWRYESTLCLAILGVGEIPYP